VVGAAAAAFWAFTEDPIPCRLVAAADSASGCVVTNDIRFSSSITVSVFDLGQGRR
jgi:hypothetical protein